MSAPDPGSRRSRRISVPRAIGVIGGVMTGLLLVTASPAPAQAAPGDDWGMERSNRDPELVNRRFDKLRKAPFDRKQWRALEKAIGRKALARRIESALRKRPSDTPLIILDARMKLLQGKARTAAQALESIEAKVSKSTRGRVFELRMDALAAAGDHRAQVAALEGRAATTNDPKTTRALLTRAYKAADRGGLEPAAVRLATRLAELSPKSLDAQRRLASAASRGGDTEAAEKAYGAAMGLTKGGRAKLSLRLEWARARGRAGDVDGATRLLWEALEGKAKLGPADRERVWNNLEDIYRAAGADDSLVARLDTWLKGKGKGDPIAWKTAAAARARSGLDPVEAWRRAAALEPRDIETRKSLILALDAGGRPQEALAEFRKLDQKSALVGLGIELANRMIPNGERDAAMDLGLQLESMAGRNADALMMLVDFYNLNDEPPRALRVARQLVKSHPRDPEARIVLGEQLFQMHEIKEALKEWAMLPKLIRPSHKGWARHAEILSEHNVREAKNSLQKALAKAPREPRYLRLQALIQTEQRVPHEALKTWQKLLAEAKGPKNRLLRDEARTRVVHILVDGTSSRMVKARDEAERQARTTLNLAKDPEEAIEAGLFLAELYTREQKFREAVMVQERLVELEPNNAQYLSALALGQRRAGLADAAMTTLERLMEVDPKRGADLLSEISDLAFASGETGRVLKAASQANSQGIDSSGALLRLGELYERRGDTEAAARTYEGILKARPKDGATMLHLAELRLTRGELDEAQRLFKAILALDASAGQPEVVHKAFRRALDLAEASDQLLEILDYAVVASKRNAGSNESLEMLLDTLDRTPPTEVRGWVGLGDSNAPRETARVRLNGLRTSLLQSLARGPVGARQRAASHLGKLALPDTAAPLARIGAHLSPPRNATRTMRAAYTRARATALRAAGELDDNKAVPVFAELLRSPVRFSQVRYAAAWALTRSSSKDAAPSLRPFVRSYDDAVMAALACITLARPGNELLAEKERINIAQRALRSRGPHGRHACAYAHAAITPDDRLDRLVADLDHSDPIVAGIAAWRLGEVDPKALGETKTRELIEALFGRFVGARGVARDAAGASLVRLIGGRDGASAERADAVKSLPSVHRGSWEVAIERWLRSRIAPSYRSLSAASLGTYLPELERAIAAATAGTRAQRHAAREILATCASEDASKASESAPEANRRPGPHCLGPLVDGPVRLRVAPPEERGSAETAR